MFGMTLPAATKMAETRFDKAWDRMPRSERNEFTKEDQAAWVKAEAEKIMAEGGVRQVSPPFDAPAFANDWIELAKRTAGARRCRVMCRGDKRDKDGNVIFSKTTLRPVQGWVPYIGAM
ncbi:hypothetical protein ODI_R1209 [Orrella dioscoreae]|uniref:Uncharacterized protein n=1 Tax=Orrella dioscoreae TaxID=1851544 RepID=A0A1C3K7R6_9BURK|nr:hypothetical protein ODI_02471 [Orrella dioscoreae]SOE48060.1 hypothetical protein ODI_R1209 [Orrella dioscoreae]